MQNIDRLALIIAAILVVGGIASAHLTEDEGAKYTSQISEYTDKISDLEADQKVQLDPPRDPASEISKVFALPRPEAGATWSWYRRPALLEKTQPQEATLPNHSAPTLTRVSAEPDSAERRFVFRLELEPGENRNLGEQKLYVEMRSEEGDWVDQGSPTVSGGQVKIDLGPDSKENDVYAKRYAFRLRSVATSGVETPLPADQETLYSAESDLVFLPKNEYWYLYSVSRGDLTGTRPGRIGVKWQYWDFDKGAETEEKDNFDESDDFVKGVKLWDSGWAFIRILDKEKAGDPDLVQIKHLATRDKKKLEKNVKPAGFTSTPWEAPEEPEEGDGEADANAGDGEATPPKPSNDDDDGGIFGDG